MQVSHSKSLRLILIKRSGFSLLKTTVSAKCLYSWKLHAFSSVLTEYQPNSINLLLPENQNGNRDGKCGQLWCVDSVQQLSTTQLLAHCHQPRWGRWENRKNKNMSQDKDSLISEGRRMEGVGKEVIITFHKHSGAKIVS